MYICHALACHACFKLNAGIYLLLYLSSINLVLGVFQNMFNRAIYPLPTVLHTQFEFLLLVHSDVSICLTIYALFSSGFIGVPFFSKAHKRLYSWRYSVFRVKVDLSSCGKKKRKRAEREGAREREKGDKANENTDHETKIWGGCLPKIIAMEDTIGKNYISQTLWSYTMYT